VLLVVRNLGAGCRLANSSVEGSAFFFLLCLTNVLQNFDNMSLVIEFSGGLRGEESWRRFWNLGICKHAGEVQVLSKCVHLVSDELQELLREQPHDLILMCLGMFLCQLLQYTEGFNLVHNFIIIPVHPSN
jgi:hypothetical protein